MRACCAQAGRQGVLMTKFLLFCVLLFFCWPLALLAVVL
jgi:hypothetical protein